MNRILFILALFMTQSAFSQVSLEKNKLVKDGFQYKYSEYEKVFENQEARNYFRKARTNKTVGEIFAYAGGFGLGFGLAQALRGENKKITTNSGPTTVKVEKAKGGWAFVGIGAGLIGIGVPFAIASNKNAEKALNLENGESTAFQPYFKLEMAGNGMALSYNF